MTEIKSGDYVIRTGRGHAFLDSNAAYLVKDVHPNGKWLRLADFPTKTFNAVYFEVVKAPQPEPEPAEEGLFIVVQMDGDDAAVRLTQHKHWVDAEKAAGGFSGMHPRETFGVLKLVGTVTMKPSWS